MMIKNDIKKRPIIRFIRIIFFIVVIILFTPFILLMILSSIKLPPEKEVTQMSPYAQVIGSEYRIIGVVDAYGIYEDLDKKVISFITLIPGVIRICGSEVAFRKRIVKGQKIKILSAWRQNAIFYNRIIYIIELQDADLPQGVQVRIELTRGNEGVEEGELNPSIYEKVSK